MRGIVLTTAALLLVAGLSGCIGNTNSEEDLQAGSADPNPSAPTPGTSTQEIPFQQEGSFPLYTVDANLVGVTLNLNDQGHEVFEVPTNNTIQTANLTMTWEAASPVMEELGLAVAWDCGDGSNCQSELTVGASPLDLSVEDVGEDEKAYVLVFAPRHGTGQANVRVSHAQDFQVEGTFTVLVPPQGG